MRQNKYTMFKLSEPWGYYPPDVEKRISQYEAALKDLNSKYAEQKQVSLSYEEKINKLESELRSMHLQMSSLELPEAEEAVSSFVLDDFKHYHDPSYNEMPEPPIIQNNVDNEIKIKNSKHKIDNLLDMGLSSNNPTDNNDDDDDGFTILQ